MTSGEQTITRLLREWFGGRKEAFDDLHELVHGELRKIAKSRARKEGHEEALGTTTLLQEAYASLLGKKSIPWKDRKHFYRVAAKVMCRIVVDQAREKQASKRGPNLVKVPLDGVAILSGNQATPEFVLSIKKLVGELYERDSIAAQVVELRYFVGFTIEEVADILEISSMTVSRKWDMARSWLYQRLQERQNGR